MTLKEEDRKAVVSYRIEQAQTAIEDAKNLFERKKLALAVNRIYYSIFYIISAAAVKDKFKTSKHKQLLGWFNKNILKPK